MKFSAMILFSLVWGTVVYCPLCHWVWDGGILAYGATRRHHGRRRWTLPAAPWSTSAPAFRLWSALVLGKRRGYGHAAMPPP